jgi:hypothetical protein
MSDTRASESATVPLAVGQEWRHIGGDGIQATGLLVRIEEIVPGGFLVTYPELGPRRGRGGAMTRPVRYTGRTLGRRYVLEREA